MSDSNLTEARPPEQLPPDPMVPDADEPRWRRTVREITGGTFMISVLSVVLALIVGGVLIAVTDDRVNATAGYFFARPGDTFAAIWDAVASAYWALFQGAVYNFRVDDFARGIRPLTETLTFSAPLIAAGLGIGLTFRVAMFNIGGRGQMLMAAAAAGYIAAYVPMPPVIHLVVAVAAGIVAGGIWGGIVGLLKAQTGAHEVIVTIMLNFVALYLVSYMLRTQGLLQQPGSTSSKTAPMLDTAVFPDLLGPRYNLHWGFVLVVAATIFTWWLLERSSLGFKFRAVGINPRAAKVAGINVKGVYIWSMTISGALVGIAGLNQMLGTVTSGFSVGIDAGIGFDAITVALLGRSRPFGIFAAGLLFGAFKAGGFAMQAAEQIPIDIVLVVQSMIVLFIAAPPLVRAIFRLPDPGSRPRARRAPKVEVAR